MEAPSLRSPESIAHAPVVAPAAWGTLALLSLVNAVNYTDRMALAVLVEPIKQDLALSDTQIGLLTGVAFALFYSLLGVPIARYADRANRTRLISVTLTFWSVMAALGGAAQNFFHLFLSRIGVGAGEAGCIPASHSLIADLFPRERRPLALSLFNIGAMVGIMAGLGAAGWLAAHYGWRLTLVLTALPGLLLVPFVFMLREPPRGALDGADAPAPLALRAAVRTLFGRRSFPPLALATALISFAAIGIAQWTPAFMMRSHAMNLEEVGAAYSLANGIASILGLLLGGWLLDRYRHRDPRWSLWISAGAIALTCPLTIAALLIDGMMPMIVLLTLSALIGNIPAGPLVASIQSVTHPRARALASAVTALGVSLLAFGVGPLAVGAASDALTATQGADALRYALVAISFTYLGGIGLMIWAAAHLRADLAKAAAD